MEQRAEVKLYSLEAICISTILGGPLVAGILIRQNLIKIGKPKQGNMALLISIVATIVFLGAVLWISEDTTIKKLSHRFSPYVPHKFIHRLVRLLIVPYVVFFYFFYKKFHGIIIGSHQFKGAIFYAVKEVIRVAIPSSILTFLIGMGIWSSIDSIQGYQRQMIKTELRQIETELKQNEIKAFDDSAMLDRVMGERVAHINEIALPAIQKNLLLINRLEQLKSDPPPKVFYAIMRQQCLIRIKLLKLLRECALAGKSDNNPQVNELKKQIREFDNKLTKIKKNIQKQKK